MQSCIDLKNSAVYFVNVRFLKILDKPVTVNEIPEIDLLQLLPFDVDEFIRKCQAYGKNLFNKENFVSYTNGIIQPMPKIIGVGMVVVLFFMLLIKVIKALYFRQVKPKRKYKDTIPLKVFKFAFEGAIIKTYFWICSFISFVRAHSTYFTLFVLIWLVNFNVLTIPIEFVAFYFFFLATFSFTTIHIQLLKLLIDVVIVVCQANIFVVLTVMYIMFLKTAKKIAYNILDHHEAQNKGVINDLPLVTMNCGKMNTKKTTSITDMGLSTSVIFRYEALNIILKNRTKFQNFPWLRFEDDLKVQFDNHTVFNLSSCKKFIYDRVQIFMDEPCKENIWDYNIERYPMYYNDDLKIINIFVALIEYAKAYLIYTVNTSLIYSNYAIREDTVKIDGYFPLWDDDFFRKDPAISAEFSKMSHILDQDMLRLGEKMVKDNIATGAFEFGVVIITEVGKERGNSKENKKYEKTKDANQNNDYFNYSLKMARHRATVGNYPFIRFFTDEQRPESWGADARDVCDVINIPSCSDMKMAYKGLIFDRFFHEVISPKIENTLLNLSHLRPDNTLLQYVLRNIKAFMDHRYERLENRFGYYVLDYETRDGTLDGNVKKYKYFSARKKVYSDRYSTDCYSDLFEQMSLLSGVGIEDILTYKDTKATAEELELQNSYFYRDISSFLNLKDETVWVDYSAVIAWLNNRVPVGCATDDDYIEDEE